MITDSHINKKSKWMLMAGVFAFWTLIFAFNIGQSLFNGQLRQQTPDWPRVFLWNMGWFIWIGFTPLVVWIARKVPFSQKAIISLLIKHVGMGMGVAFVFFMVDLTSNYVLHDYFIEKNPAIDKFYGLLFYKFHINFLVYTLIVGVTFAFDYFQKSTVLEVETSLLEKQLASAQLESLKMQLNPHFLFNTHQAIMGLMMKKENDTAIAMLTKLSDLLRITLDSNGKQLVPLKEELEILEMYLQIHQIRFGDRLKVHWQIAKNTLNCPVPNFILQPLVENAIQHAIAVHSSAQNITIQSEITDNRLSIEITDDGQGIQGEMKEGVGWKNTKERLTQLYKNDYVLSYENREPNGLKVKLELNEEL